MNILFTLFCFSWCACFAWRGISEYRHDGGCASLIFAISHLCLILIIAGATIHLYLYRRKIARYQEQWRTTMNQDIHSKGVK